MDECNRMSEDFYDTMAKMIELRQEIIQPNKNWFETQAAADKLAKLEIEARKMQNDLKKAYEKLDGALWEQWRDARDTVFPHKWFVRGRKCFKVE